MRCTSEQPVPRGQSEIEERKEKEKR